MDPAHGCADRLDGLRNGVTRSQHFIRATMHPALSSALDIQLAVNCSASGNCIACRPARSVDEPQTLLRERKPAAGLRAPLFNPR